VSAHMAGSNENQYVLWDMLLLERWHTMFIDQPIGVSSRSDRATLNALR
jgi:hypothetical protein